MIFLYLLAGVIGVLNFIFGLLPGPTFLAMPDAVGTALHTISEAAGWALGLAGTEVKAAVLTLLPIMVGLKVAFALWDIIKNFRPVNVPLVLPE